jgi:HD-GYP domain-containing protein (c-di-GMP phosphodiesterase class II)
MDKQYLCGISPKTIELGPISFDLFTPSPRGGMMLFCRAGFEIVDRHKAILDRLDRPFYIKSGDKEAYADYAFDRLETIISDPRIRVKDKAEVLHQVGLRSVKQLMASPEEKKVIKQSEKVVTNYVNLILSSPDAASNLFALSSLDAYTYSHSINVSTLNMLIGEYLFPHDHMKLWELGMAGLLHDIGKTKVDQNILFKRGKLTNREFSEMKKHVLFSYELINEHKYNKDIQEAGKYHHERFEGGGYPDNLRGDEINLFARLTGVNDVYDAITSKRVYKDKKPHIEALEEMALDIGHFDPELYDILLKVVLRNDELVMKFKQEHNLQFDEEDYRMSYRIVSLEELEDIEIV